MKPLVARMTDNSEDLQRENGFLLLRSSVARMIDNSEDFQREEGLLLLRPSVAGMMRVLLL